MRTFLLALGLLIAVPALGQDIDKRTGDVIQRDHGDPGAQEDFGRIMDRTLPFKDGQLLRYFNEKGQFDLYAKRQRLTIRFYEPDGTFVGRAERVSQAATNYYAPDGQYLGRRLHKKQTMKGREDVQNPSIRGFYFPHLEPRNQE
jgi:hypothetical protein